MYVTKKFLEENSEAIKTALELLDNCVSGNELQVDVITQPPVSIGDVDINDISKGVQTNDVKVTLDSEQVTEVNSTDIKNALQTLDNIVSGNEAQVDIITMPNVTEVNSSAIKTALQILDNIVSGNEAQCDIITMPNVTVASMPTTDVNIQEKAYSWAHTQLTADGNIIGAPGVGTKLRIYKIFVCNHSTTNMGVELRNGAGGTVKMHLFITNTGGHYEIDLWPGYFDLSNNTAFYGDLGFGVAPRMDFSVLYEVV